MDDRHARLRLLPKIDDVLRRDELRALPVPRWAVLEAVRAEVDRLRAAIQAGAGEPDGPVEIDLERVRARCAELARPSLRRVVNATGVVLHTNLGRAPLAAAALDEVAAVAGGYSNLEYEVGEGKRGSRHAHLERLLGELCGAEAAAVVNNNAAAVLLCLTACASGREVVVSRGELVEIGGSFRIPDVMRVSGARLIEVGTTNKTRAGDYQGAVGPDTAMFLKVHRSNFRIVGFTEEVQPAELAELARRRGILSMIDLGSGSLIDAAEMTALGLPPEPDVRASVASGADLVTFSGDKLLGGPQAGVIAGRADAIARVRAHPLMRALRPDKMTLAALHATLRLYRDGRSDEVPVLAMLRATPAALRARAEALLARIGPAGQGRAEVVACRSTVGGGALPAAEVDSFAVALSGAPADALDAALRAAPVPVVARIADDRVLLDVRTLPSEADLDAAAAAARAALGGG
jgi:L-seryl-tRNA(Ser) seleniumtransferase